MKSIDPHAKRALIATLLVSALQLSACIAMPAESGDTRAVVTMAPPLPQVEVVTVAPAPGYIWIGGWWGWEGRRHVWHPGHYVAPRSGYRWVPHGWVQTRGGWRERPGRWER